MNTMLPLDQLEAVLREMETVDEEMLRRIIKENATDGGLLRTAAKEGYLNVVKFFLEAKDKFELTAEEIETTSNRGAADEKGNTILHIAASNGHVCIVEYIISSGETIDIINQLVETPLYLACREGHKRVVKLLLLQHRSTPNSWKAPINIAAINGNAALVGILLDSGEFRGRALSSATQAGHADVVALLLEHCADSGLLDSEHFAIHEAARKGHIHIMKMLLNAGAHASEMDRDGYTPMAVASEYGHIDIVQLLLSLGTSTELSSYSPQLRPSNIVYKSPLDCAVVNGHIGITKLLLSHGFTLNTKFVLERMIEEGRPLAILALLAMGEDYSAIKETRTLHIACARKHLEMARFLLQRKMSVYAWDKELNTPLHTACMYARNESIIKLLISNGAVVNALNQDGNTPLFYAKDLASQRILIESGGDPHIPNNAGTTALHKATSVESVQLLLKCNVLVDARTTRGVTPLMEACLQRRVDIAETLLEHGACINTTDDENQTPLIKGIYGGIYDSVKFRMLYGHVVYYQHHRYKTTGIHLASGRKDFETALLLLKLGASVNVKDSLGNSALYYAAARNACGIMQLLIEYGAHVNSVNKRGQTPLHVVRSAQAAQILRRKEANISLKDLWGTTALDSSKEYAGEVYLPE